MNRQRRKTKSKKLKTSSKKKSIRGLRIEFPKREMDQLNENFDVNVFEALPEVNVEDFKTSSWYSLIVDNYSRLRNTSNSFKLTSSSIDFTTKKGTDVSLNF